jgi:SIR2-like domain
MPLDSNDLARIRSQMSRAEIILFTGAGFSLGAKDRNGVSIPSVFELKNELWKLCYPEQSFDPSSSLADLYAASLRRQKSDLVRLISARFSADPDSLPEYYATYFGLPWLRYYTLNVDDLDRAAAVRYHLERPPLTISTRASETEGAPSSLPKSGRLEVVHLNGVVGDSPDLLTFSETQYAEGIASQEPWYARCVADIMCRPVIFIGTVLNESLLWQHMELRRRRDRHGRDLRPTSILVTPSLSLPRQEILRDFRIEWVEGTAESFAAEVLKPLTSEATRGFAFIRAYTDQHGSGPLLLASQAASENPSLQTEYLLGEEPHWSDVISGRAIERSHDEDLSKVAHEILEGRRTKAALAVTGTAGTGKSTALMSLALRLSGAGIPVLWLDKDSDVSLARVRDYVGSKSGKLALAIDDADLYGRQLVTLLCDLVTHNDQFLFVFAIRSGKVDEIVSAIQQKDTLEVYEHVVPPLTDEDIEGLIGVLDKHNRLGKLKGASDQERRRAFKEQAGRQMLVAMIQATSSSDNFEKKAHNELTELSGAQRYVYSLASVASSMRQYLTRDEIVLASADFSEEALSALERLTARHLIVGNPPTYRYRSRHRVIADLVLDKLQELKELKDVLAGLSWAIATKISPSVDRRDRLRKFLTALSNHAFLRRLIGIMDARDLYRELEKILSWDYHYWLQRGSLEVEAGDIKLADNFLSAAYSMAEGDYRVQTAYAYMLMRKAWESPQEVNSASSLARGVEILRDAISTSGGVSPYPFHVLGSQGLAWVHRAALTRDEKRGFLRDLIANLELALRLHPRKDDLVRLKEDVEKEWLLTTVTPRSS